MSRATMAAPERPVSLSPAMSVALGVVLAIASAVVAICASLVSRSVWRPGPVSLPWGLVLAIAGSVATVIIARTLAGRGHGFVAGAGWVGGIAATLVWHPGGDYLIANDELGIGFLLLATGGVLVTAGWGA